jgi:hypothetical protein
VYIPEAPADSVDGVDCDRSTSALAGAIMSSLMPALVLPETLGLLAVLELAFNTLDDGASPSTPFHRGR